MAIARSTGWLVAARGLPGYWSYLIPSCLRTVGLAVVAAALMGWRCPLPGTGLPGYRGHQTTQAPQRDRPTSARHTSHINLSRRITETFTRYVTTTTTDIRSLRR